MADIGVKIYLIRRWIDGAWYGGSIPAATWDDAKDVCRRLGWRLDGEYVTTLPVTVGPWLPNIIVRVRNWMGG